MFICRACSRKVSTTVQRQMPVVIRSLNYHPTIPSVRSLGRPYATATVGSDQPETEIIDEDEDDSPSRSSPRQRRIELDIQQQKQEKRREWAVKKQLEFLKDPFHTANHVRTMLDKGDYDEALLLVRKAGVGKQVVVSWNHLIDYTLEKQRLHAAIKLYNEMKSRGQLPNAQTFTIIFRGCANSIHPKTAVGEAVRLYTTMMNSDRLKPNTIHMNAVLDCCARAGDLDAMFSIVNTANEHLRAPNNHTYTIILNALQYKVTPLHRDLAAGHASKDKGDDAIAVAVQRAKAIWEEIMQQWRKGSVVIDEELVCAMGRVLLMGEYQDNEDILALVEQTMQIPRLDKVEGKSLPSRAKPAASTPSAESAGPDGLNGEAGTGQRRVSAPQRNGPRGMTPSLLYAQPGRNTLSLLMMAIANLRKTSLAPKYWDLLTQDLGVKPDMDNYHKYLRSLRNGRASERVANLIATMPREMIAEKTFRLGFTACVRDNVNQHAFANACVILERMKKSLRIPDPMALRMFLQVAKENIRKFVDQEEKDPAGSRMAWGRQLVTAVDLLWEPFRVLSSSFSYPEMPSRSPEEEWGRQRDKRMETLRTARSMMSALDKVMMRSMCGPQVMKVVKERKNTLNRYIARLYEKTNSMDAKVERRGGERGPSRYNQDSCRMSGYSCTQK